MTPRHESETLSTNKIKVSSPTLELEQGDTSIYWVAWELESHVSLAWRALCTSFWPPSLNAQVFGPDQIVYVMCVVRGGVRASVWCEVYVGCVCCVCVWEVCGVSRLGMALGMCYYVEPLKKTPYQDQVFLDSLANPYVTCKRAEPHGSVACCTSARWDLNTLTLCPQPELQSPWTTSWHWCVYWHRRIRGGRTFFYRFFKHVMSSANYYFYLGQKGVKRTEV